MYSGCGRVESFPLLMIFGSSIATALSVIPANDRYNILEPGSRPLVIMISLPFKLDFCREPLDTGLMISIIGPPLLYKGQYCHQQQNSGRWLPKPVALPCAKFEEPYPFFDKNYPLSGLSVDGPDWLGGCIPCGF